MVFRVKQTAQADRDLDLILEWLLAQQAGEAGLRWFQIESRHRLAQPTSPPVSTRARE
jgi:hypothetical protein